jgi:diguanylate cyclase (GGDEF)-like protein
VPSRARRSPSPSARADLASRLRPLQAALRTRLSRADALGELIRDVHTFLEPDRVAEVIAAHASKWLPIAGWLVLSTDDGGQPRLLASRGLAEAMEATAVALGLWVMQKGEACGVRDLSADARVSDGAAVAGMAFPLACRGRAVGAIVGIDRASSEREPRLTPATAKALSAALEPAAFALDNALRMERAEELSVTDDLTSLYNSRYLSQVLRRETKRAGRSNRPLSLLFLDLDGFKAINDTHGHLYGSRALVEAAAVIKSSARETDVVARYGGDEFALVLPDTSREGAVAVGARIRERVAAHSFLVGDGLDIRLTVSVGVATLPDVATSAETLIEAADLAMYHVKEHGKDGIYVAGE